MSNRPHDALVGEVFGHPEHARGELQHLLLPALSTRIDWATHPRAEHLRGRRAARILTAASLDEALDEPPRDA